MRSVALSDPMYDEAARAAAARGQSLEEFVAEAVRLHANDEEDEAPLVLTPEQIAKVRKAQEDVRAGRVFTLEESRERLAKVQAEWLEANPQ